MEKAISNRRSTARFARAGLFTVLLAVLASFSAASPAAAYDYQFCSGSQSQTMYDYCPGIGYGSPLSSAAISQAFGDRHTFKNSRVSYEGRTSGCDLYVNTGAVLAFENSNGSQWKYLDARCQYIKLDFPSNTQLLRDYGWHNGNNQGGTGYFRLVGIGKYE